MRLFRLLILSAFIMVFSFSVSAQLPSDAVRAIQWNADNSLLAISRQNGIVEIIDGETLDQLQSIQAQISGPVIELEWHPNLQIPYLATGGTEGVIKVWDVASGNNVANLVGASPELITGISWNSTGNQIIGFTISGRTILWDWNITTNTVIFEAPGFTPYSPTGAWSIDGLYYAVVTSSSVGIFDATSPNEGQLLVGLNEHTNVIGDIAWSPNPNTPHILVSAGADQTVRFWDAPAEELLYTVELAENPIMVEFSPDGSMVAVIDISGTITVWDVDNFTFIQEFETSSIPIFSWQSNDTITYIDENNEVAFINLSEM